MGNSHLYSVTSLTASHRSSRQQGRVDRSYVRRTGVDMGNGVSLGMISALLSAIFLGCNNMSIGYERTMKAIVTDATDMTCRIGTTVRLHWKRHSQERRLYPRTALCHCLVILAFPFSIYSTTIRQLFLSFFFPSLA